MPEMKTGSLTLRIILGTAVIGACTAGGLAWQAKGKRQATEATRTEAARLIQSGAPREALPIIWREEKPGASQEWARLEVEALAAARELPRLLQLHKSQPQLIQANETASWLVASALIHSRDQDAAAILREHWKGRETQKGLWLAYDADGLIATGQADEAEKLLKATPLSGPDDAIRLIRLSMLTLRKDPAETWRLLGEATERDPKNADAHSFKAQMLEAAGKLPEAEEEYTAATQAEPSNPIHQNKLAEFLCRSGNVDRALASWRTLRETEGGETIRLKIAFWEKMAAGFTAAKQVQPKHGSTTDAFIAAMLPTPGVYWNDAMEAAAGRVSSNFARRQELNWLKIIQILHDGRETEARQLLAVDGLSKESLAPELARALLRIIHYRTEGKLNPPELANWKPGKTPAARHQFFEQLDQAATAESGPIDPSLDQFLHSDAVFAGALLAAGWREASLGLGLPEKCQAGAPEWLAYGAAVSLRLNRGLPVALAFVKQQKPTPALDACQGELLLALGRSDEARPILERAVRHGGPAAAQALALLAMDDAQRGDGPAARQHLKESGVVKEESEADSSKPKQ